MGVGVKVIMDGVMVDGVGIGLGFGFSLVTGRVIGCGRGWSNFRPRPHKMATTCEQIDGFLSKLLLRFFTPKTANIHRS